MRILFSSFAPFIGGAEVAVARLARGLIDAGHQVHLVVGTKGKALEHFEQAGISCTYVAARFTSKLGWLSYARSRASLISVIRDFKPDIVHANDLPTHQITSDASRRAHVANICHHRWIYDGAATDWLNKFGAHRHIFVSRWLRDALTSQATTLDTNVCHVVYDGLELPPPPSSVARVDCKKSISIDADTPLIVFAGQVIERKGVADIIAAWSRLSAWHNRARLVIVGDDVAGKGEYRRKMELLAQDLGCPVTFAGFQANVSKWLTASDVVLVPSHTEPLGNATLEAMALSRTVIGTRVGGIPEMIEDGRTGILVSPRSPDDLARALVYLLEHPDRRCELGEAARRRCETTFSLNAHITAMIEQYQSTLASADTISTVGC